MVDHPAARALTGYLLVRGGVHQVAYARALENLTGADMMKLFPSPRIPTEKIPECRPHIERGEHLKLYRFSQDDFKELAAVFNGPHPETGEPLTIAEEIHPEGAPPLTCRRSRLCSRPAQSRRKSRRSRPNCARPPASRRSRQALLHRTQTERPTVTATATA
jgi:Mn-containing catalase